MYLQHVVLSPLEAAAVFDNSVDCIRQPRRNEIDRQDKDSSRQEPLREAGVRAVDPKCLAWVVPGSGVGMARKDRHTLLVGRGLTGLAFLWIDARKGT